MSNSKWKRKFGHTFQFQPEVGVQLRHWFESSAIDFSWRLQALAVQGPEMVLEFERIDDLCPARLTVSVGRFHRAYRAPTNMDDGRRWEAVELYDLVQETLVSIPAGSEPVERALM